MFRFQKLEVWQKAVQFANHIYELTKTFPTDERFGLTSQMRRAAVSISANIAEGSGRVSDKDFARFLEIAYGSLMEALSHGMIANQQGLITSQEIYDLLSQGEESSRMLSGLRSKITGT